MIMFCKWDSNMVYGLFGLVDTEMASYCGQIKPLLLTTKRDVEFQLTFPNMFQFQSKFTSAQLQATRSLLRCMKYECCNRFDKQNYQQIWARKKRSIEDEEIVYVTERESRGNEVTGNVEEFEERMDRDFEAPNAEEDETIKVEEEANPWRG